MWAWVGAAERALAVNAPVVACAAAALVGMVAKLKVGFIVSVAQIVVVDE
jgi:hypothetical protein